MADVPANQGDIADQLANARATARLKQQAPPSGRSLYAPSLPVASTNRSRGADYEGAREKFRQDYGQRLGDSQTGGAPLSGLEQQAVAGRLQADRVRDSRRKQIAEERLENRKKKQQTGKSDPDYPNPISFRKFVGFGFIAMGQDLLPLIFDLVAIGWIIEYCLLPITWSAYWYLIVRWTPRSLRKKFWQRTIMITAVGWIPVVGQFIPEWTATAIGAYIVISLYERRQATLATGKKSLESRGEGKKGASKLPDVKSSAAAQTLPR